jgi:hypothetical protein
VNLATHPHRHSRSETASTLLALALLVASTSAVLIAAGEARMFDPDVATTTRIPPIDAEAPDRVETMSFGLG